MDTPPDIHDQCVLIIDDDQAVLDALRISLHKAPFCQLYARSAYQALQMLDSRQIDIVVTDELMPGMSGTEFFNIVRHRYPDMIRIIISGQASKEQIIDAINSGQINFYISKPVHSDKLIQILSKFLSNLRFKATKRALIIRSDTLGRWEWDIRGGECTWSKHFERLMHCTPSATNGDFTRLFGSVHPEDRAALVSVIHNCKDTGHSCEAEHRIVLPDGSTRWIVQYVDTFRDEDREWKLIGILHDITDQKEKEFLQSERLVILQKTLDNTVEALGRMTEIRDPYTAGHQARVARIAVQLGKILNLDSKMLFGLEVASKLHDIGKIYVPSEFLAKPGRLREAEMTLIKYHSEIGYDIIRDIPFVMPVADIVLQHHERLDGSGYPKGLKGRNILFEARILAVADVFEAMSSHRPYRPSLGTEVALNELLKNKGTTFDSRVVDALLALLEEKPNFMDELFFRTDLSD